MNIHSLFPTSIGVSKLSRELTATERSFLVNQNTQDNVGNTYSKETYILNRPELKNLQAELLSLVRIYFKSVYNPENDLDVYITQSWVNYTKPGAHHHVHAHYNSFISGVFYVHSEGDADRIMFHRSGYDLIRFEPIEWNLYNARSWWFPVNTGDVVLFPSNLPHEVPSTTSSEDRVSLAFNVFLKGHLGSYKEITELNLE